MDNIETELHKRIEKYREECKEIFNKGIDEIINNAVVDCKINKEMYDHELYDVSNIIRKKDKELINGLNIIYYNYINVERLHKYGICYYDCTIFITDKLHIIVIDNNLGGLFYDRYNKKFNFKFDITKSMLNIINEYLQPYIVDENITRRKDKRFLNLKNLKKFIRTLINEYTH